MKQDINKWRETQRRGMLKYQKNQRKKNLELQKKGLLFPKVAYNEMKRLGILPIKIRKVPIDKNISWYKKTLWRWFSRYIRLRDSDEDGICTCITCGRKHKWDSGQIDAGHYIPKNTGNAIYFDEKDVNAQCKYCNKYLHGNLAKYRPAIDKKYGPGTADALEIISRETVSFTEKELIKKINYYKIEVKKLLQIKDL